MKTTKEERREVVDTWPFNNQGVLIDLIADAEEAARRLRQQHEALAPNKKLPHSLCGVCDFLKEPSDA